MFSPPVYLPHTRLRNLAVGTLLLALSGTAHASLTIVQSTQPSESDSLFKVWGSAKSDIDSLPASTNASSGPWIDRVVVRSWELSWNNASQLATFSVFLSEDQSRLATLIVTQPCHLDASHILLGLAIGVRLDTPDQTVTIGHLAFDGGNGLAEVPASSRSYLGQGELSTYYSLEGQRGDFTLVGRTDFPPGTSTSATLGFFIDAREGLVTPTPGSLALLSLGSLCVCARKRR